MVKTLLSLVLMTTLLSAEVPLQGEMLTLDSTRANQQPTSLSTQQPDFLASEQNSAGEKLAKQDAIFASLLARLQGVELQMEIIPTEISIGDRFEIKLTLEYPEELIAEMPHGIAQLGDFEVISFSSKEPKKSRKGWVQQEWSYQLALFGSGDFLLRPLLLLLTDTASQSTFPIASDPALISSVSRGLDSTADIADDEPPVSLSPPLPRALWISLLAVGVIALLLFFWRKKVKRLWEPPHLRALREIDQLLAKGDGLSEEQGRHNLFCLKLGLTMRGYLDNRFGMETLEKTTSELRTALRSEQNRKSALAKWIDPIENFSRRTDMVKFAGDRLATGEAEELAELVKKLIHDTAPTEKEGEAQGDKR